MSKLPFRIQRNAETGNMKVPLDLRLRCFLNAGLLAAEHECNLISLNSLWLLTTKNFLQY